MDYMRYAVPDYVYSNEIKELRKEMGLTQTEFADMIGCSKPTVVRWEKSREKIRGPIVFAIYAMKNCETLREKILLPEMKYGIRLLYMHKQNLCTIIDVDEINEKIEIINYTENIMFKAFGANRKPSYDDYLDFLETRCFPRTRDKMKLILDDLNLPFYDPFLIIEKTMGRMAEDDFWIKVERKW